MADARQLVGFCQRLYHVHKNVALFSFATHTNQDIVAGDAPYGTSGRERINFDTSGVSSETALFGLCSRTFWFEDFEARLVKQRSAGNGHACIMRWVMLSYVPGGWSTEVKLHLSRVLWKCGQLLSYRVQAYFRITLLEVL